MSRKNRSVTCGQCRQPTTASIVAKVDGMIQWLCMECAKKLDKGDRMV